MRAQGEETKEKFKLKTQSAEFREGMVEQRRIMSQRELPKEREKATKYEGGPPSKCSDR